MEASKPITIQIAAAIQAPVEKVWSFFTEPGHVVNWNHASDDWVCPRAENDLRPGGKFSFRMEARDGSMGFDFCGTYSEVVPRQLITYTMDDDRKVRVEIAPNGHHTELTEWFEAETQHAPELQRQGWQAILDNFKQYVESH